MTQLHKEILEMMQMQESRELRDLARIATAVAEHHIAQYEAKAAKWDALAKQMAKFYEEDSDADLGDIGEAAAIAFGYL